MSQPIVVYVNYPHHPELQFDTDYYINTHLAIVDKHWRPFGLQAWSVVQFPADDPSGLHTQCTLHFDSRESFDKAWDANIPEVMNDLKNYSNKPPTRYIGRLLKQG